MKKPYTLPLLVLLSILCLTLINDLSANKNTARWCGQLQQAVFFVQAEEWDQAEAVLKESYADWSAHQTYLHIISTHDEINAAESMYHRALAFAAAREPSELQAEVAGLQTQLKFLSEMERFSIRNIL